MGKINILVVSDLHVGDVDDLNASTRITVGTPDKPIHNNPVESLKAFIKQYKEPFNAVINLGDVSNKGFVPGWILGVKILKEVATICSCPLINTPGNHDYCFEYKPNAETLLKNTNDYPTDDEQANSHFWDKGFCLYNKIKNLHILLLNSEKALTSLGDLEKCPDYEVLFNDKLDEYLQSYNNLSGPKIAIVHHHVIQHSDYAGQYQANDIIDHADKLLETLSKHNFCCILHGHKHLPRYTSYNSIGIMACGSLSSLENIRICDTNNHFHVLTIDENGNGVRGVISNYYFIPRKGWFLIADPNIKLEARYSFGTSVNIDSTVHEIIKILQSRQNSPIFKSEEMPKLSLLSNNEETSIKQQLENEGYKVFNGQNHGFIVYK